MKLKMMINHRSGVYEEEMRCATTIDDFGGFAIELFSKV
jgi:hypothetical protein